MTVWGEKEPTEGGMKGRSKDRIRGRAVVETMQDEGMTLG